MALRTLAGLFVVTLVLLAPSGYFYITYLLPRTEIPEVTAETGETWSAPGLDPVLSTTLQEEVAAARSRVTSPSFSAAIAFDGELQWAGTVGFSGIETGTTAAIAGRYRIGSTSKAMTAALLMRLVVAGEIELDAPIGSYARDLPEDYAALTARQLASHTGGVRHYASVPTYWPGSHASLSGEHYESVKDGLSIFIDDPLEFEPGEAFGYSTYGYSLLSYALESATGEGFQALMRERLWHPLSMRHTAFDFGADVPGRVSFYTSGDGEYSAAYPSGASYKLAGGGIVASASDVARFGLALLGEGYLDGKSKEEMFSPVKLADGSDNPQNYGLGFRVDTSVRLLGEERPTTIIHHGGTQNGGASFFMIVPDFGISVSTLSNTGARAARGEAQSLAYALTRAVIAARE